MSKQFLAKKCQKSKTTLIVHAKLSRVACSELKSSLSIFMSSELYKRSGSLEPSIVDYAISTNFLY